MKILFEPAARDELDHIFSWIAKDSLSSALGLIARIEAKVMRLEDPALSHMGRPGLVEGTRELIEWPYIRILLSTRSTKLVKKLSWWQCSTVRRIVKAAGRQGKLPPSYKRNWRRKAQTPG
jgi:toxin ParE1/3/4